MPTPRRGETRDHYLKRCIPMVMREGLDQEQATGKCEGMFDNARGKKCGAACLPRELTPFSYELKNLGISALDSPPTREPSFDQNKMSATGVLATTRRDREGDVLEVDGIDTSNHRVNPISLLDHGLYYPLPIGICADAPKDGNYTVEILPDLGECLQTTFFSQHSEVAEQVYHLYCEGILRANSIGYRPLAIEPIPADPVRGFKKGKHITRCELVESTWCGIPCNPDAVMAALSRDRIEGKPLAYAIKAMLQPYAQPKKAWAQGATFSANLKQGAGVPTMTDKKSEMSSVDESSGGALRKAEEAPAEEVESKDAEAVTSDEPLGAELLRNFHSDLTDLCEQYSTALKKVENAKVKGKLTKMLDGMDGCTADVETLFGAEYKDLEPLKTKAKKTEDAPADESGDKKPVEKKPEDEAGSEQKTLATGKGALTFPQEFADLIVKQVVSSLEKKTQPAAEDEELSDEDRKALVALECQIARRDRMLARLGL